MLASCEAPFDDLTKVATFAVLHNDEDLEVSFVDAAVVKADNIGVLEVAKDVDLSHDLLLLFLAHFAVVELFLDEDAPVRDATDLADAAKAAYSITKTQRFESGCK